MIDRGSLELRPFSRNDRHAVRTIVCLTAFRNRGHQVVIDDAELFADYWTSYYTEFEPESCFVLERKGEVVGALLGCVDTARFHRVMARRIVPGIVRRLVWHLVRKGTSAAPTTRPFMGWLATRAWREAPEIDVVRFPAHYHLNLLRSAYGAHGYSALAIRFLEHVKAQGAPGVHGQVLDRTDSGVWLRLTQDFQAAHPDAIITGSSKASTLPRVLWHDAEPMVNRAFGASVMDFRRFLEWLRQCRRL